MHHEATARVQDGDTIALDASTTAQAVAHFLKEKRELTVVTNGLRIGMELISISGISVLIPGDMLRQESFSLVGTWGWVEEVGLTHDCEPFSSSALR